MIECTARGINPLGLAARYGHVEVVEMLIDQGADVNISNITGWTPFLKAALGGHVGIMKMLLAKGADPRATNKKGQNALALAQQQGKEEAVAYLQALQIY